MLDKKLLEKYFVQIQAGTIKSKDAAAALGIGMRQLNRLTKKAKIHRPLGIRREKEGQTILRKAVKKGATEAYMQGIITKYRAAEIADVAVRTIERWAEKLGHKE